MAVDILSICNSALATIGTRRIVALSDPSREARSCNDHFHPSRKAVLRMHKWNCATKRVILTTVEDAPAFGFLRAFTIPDDFIRVHTVWEGGTVLDEALYRVEGLTILADVTELWFKYVFDQQDVSKYDPLLDEAIAQYLAWKISPQLNASEEQRMALEKGWKAAMQRARFADSTEDPSEEFDADVWIRARTGVAGGFVRDPMT